MSSRTRYLVCYDICDPRRLRKVAKIMESFGSRIQYSVFECPLDGVQMERLKASLQSVLHHDDDQVLFVSLGPEAGNATFRIESMGSPYTSRSRVTIL